MTLLGHIKNGQIALDTPVPLPEGASVKIEVQETPTRKTFRESRADGFKPVKLPGGSLADEIIRNRR